MKEHHSAAKRKGNGGAAETPAFAIRAGGTLQSSLESPEVSRYLLDHSQDVILVLDKRAKILFANRQALTIFGYSEEEVLGKSMLRFLTPAGARKALLSLALEFVGRPQPATEFEMKSKSGAIRYLRLAEGSASIREGGKVVGILAIGADITEQRKAETDARTSDARFRDLWENAPVAYHIVDLKGTITDANQAEARLLGYRRDELIGRSVFDLIPPEHRAVQEEKFRLKIAGKPVPKPRQKTFVRKDGTRVSVIVDEALEKDAAGNVTGLRSTLVDITKLKASELALKESEELFRNLVEKSGIAIFSDSRNGHFRYFNERCAQIFGYPPEELKKLTIWQLAHPDELERLRAYHYGRLEGRDVPSRYEFRAVRKDGSVVHLEIDVTLVKEDGRAVGTRSYMWDNTDRKRAEEALRENEDQFRALSAAAQDAIIMMGNDGRVTFWSDAAERILGFSREEALGQFMHALLTPRVYQEAFEKAFPEWTRTGQGAAVGKTVELTALRKDGSEIPVEISLSSTKINGQWNAIGIVRDIADRRRAEEERRASDARFRSLVDNAHDGIILVDDAFLISYANAEAIRTFGYPREDLIGSNFRRFLDDESREMVTDMYLRRQRGEAVPNRYEFNIVREQGEKRRIEISSSVLTNAAGRKETVAQLRDITDRKKADEALRASEEKFKILFDSAPDAYYLIDGDDIVIEANKAAREMMGDAPGQKVGMRLPDEPGRHQELLATLTSIKARRAQGLPTGPDEFSGRTKAGRQVSIELRTFPIKIKGRALTLGIARDITERQRLEKALRRIEWMLTPGHQSPAPSGPAGPDGSTAMSDPVALNASRRLLDSIGPQMLQNILSDHLDLLDTSSAVFETNGEYAFSLASSAWCRYMRWASRRLCGTEDDREAISSGRWLCHESCWGRCGKKAVETGEPADIPCAGGIRCYAVPIRTSEGIIGAIKIGYGDPPADQARLKKLAAAYGVTVEELTKRAAAYESRPPYIIEMAKKRVEASARVVAEIYEHARADARLEKTLADLRKIIGATVQAIATAVEARDPYTAGHQKRVADLARAIAAEMGMPHDTVEGVRTAGMIHDLGKLSVPAEILSKPTKLSEVEYALIKTHSRSGYEILKDISFPWPVARIVLEHHERMDGSGYPQGLKGSEILIESRILAVADVVEAIASHRPYRPSKGIQAALDEVAANRGLLYDVGVVQACLAAFANGYRFPDGKPEGPGR